MAFTAGNLTTMSNAATGWNHYYYDANEASDAMATVNTAGYFNNTDDIMSMNVDDLITVKATDYTAVLKVTVASGSITTITMAQPNEPIAAGSTITLSKAEHDGRIILFDTAGGSVITLPAATGLGTHFTCIVSVTVTSATHQIVTDSDSDEFIGHVYQVDSDTSDAIAAYPGIAADNFDVISMNGTTTGGLLGDWIELVDVSTGNWAIKMFTNGNGTVATPIA